MEFIDSKEPENITFGENASKAIAYTEEAREFLRNNPGLMMTVRNIINNFGMSKDGSKVLSMNEGDVTITFIDNAAGWVGDNRRYFLVEKNNFDGTQYKFFLKLCTIFPNKSQELGAEEVLIMKKVKDILQSSGIEKVRIVDYKFGFRDQKYSYYLASFENCLIKDIQDKIADLRLEGNNDKADELQERSKRISSYLSRDGFDDVEEHNQSYDETTDEIVVFDSRVSPELMEKIIAEYAE